MNEYLNEMVGNHEDIILELDSLGFMALEDDNYTVTTNAPKAFLEELLGKGTVIKSAEPGLFSYNIVFCF